MKKLLFLMFSTLLTISVLAACSNDDITVEEDENKEANTETDKSTETNSDSKSGFFEVTEEPQLDLRLGDTGIIQTSIGTYELTIDSAEIVGTELDGEEALLDEIILLEMTFKNIDDKPIIAEDLMINLGLLTDLEGSDNTNAAASFDSIEFFEGKIAPGEERKAQFIADTRTAEEYYFRIHPRAAVAKNEVLWTITDEEARN